MKISAQKSECPLCKSGAMVMSMKTGNIHIFGCLKCRNAQGAYRSAKEAKAAWVKYVESKNETT